MRKVLFVTYGAGHAAMCAPVVRTLVNESRGSSAVAVTVLALTTARSAFESLGVRLLGYRDFTDWDVNAVKYGNALASNMPAHPLVAHDETVAYLGINFACLVRELGPERAVTQFEQRGRQAFQPVEFMRSVLQKERPDLVVTTNSPRSERAAILAARSLGIPAVCLVDLFAIQEAAWIGQPGFADTVCVLSSAVRQMFLELGRSPHEVVVTGNPAFDRLAVRPNPDEVENFRASRGWSGRPTILWASQPEPAKHPFTNRAGDPALPEKVDAALRDYARENSDATIVVRLHPSETREVRTESMPNFLVSVRERDDLAMSLCAADLVLVTSSTVGIEAALLGRRVLAYSGSIFSPDAPYAAMGLATGFDDLAELSHAVSLACLSPPADRGLPPVGSATQRVVSEVHRILS